MRLQGCVIFFENLRNFFTFERKTGEKKHSLTKFFKILCVFLAIEAHSSAWEEEGGGIKKKRNAIVPFVDASGKKYRCYYPHRLRELLSPICGIFIIFV